MFDLEAVYWTLSTIAQTMVALVAFVGFVALWRLQVLEQKRDEWIETRTRTLALRHSVDTVRHQNRVIEVTEGLVTKIRAALNRLARFGIVATALSLGLLAITPRLVGTERLAADLAVLAPIAFFVLLVVVTLALRFAWDVLSLSFEK